MQKKAPIELLSISCSTGKNQDCGILVLEQYIRNFDPEVTYNTIVEFLREHYSNFGLEYNVNEQLGADAFEAVLMHFLPNIEIELYNIIFKPNKKIETVLYRLNKGAKNKTEFRLGLKSSWNRALNTTGAGHYIILNTTLATSEKIIANLNSGNYEDTNVPINNEFYIYFFNAANKSNTFCLNTTANITIRTIINMVEYDMGPLPDAERVRFFFRFLGIIVVSSG